MWQKVFLKFFSNNLDPKDLLSLSQTLPMSTKSKLPILLSHSSFFLHFSRDFTIEHMKVPKRRLQKWSIFEAKYLFLYQWYQNDTYRGFSTWLDLSFENKILKLGNFIFNISSFNRNFRDFQKKRFEMGKLCEAVKLPNFKNFSIFWNFKNISLCPPNDFLIS